MSDSVEQNLRSGFADEYPFDSHRLDLEGIGYHYIDEGSGPTILMVHLSLIHISEPTRPY